jgi:hypothetical protein
MMYPLIGVLSTKWGVVVHFLGCCCPLIGVLLASQGNLRVRRRVAEEDYFDLEDDDEEEPVVAPKPPAKPPAKEAVGTDEGATVEGAEAVADGETEVGT